MGNNIRQLNVTYLAPEDRILLKLNTTGREEFRIWLTRRLVRRLATALGGAERQLLGLEDPASGRVTPGARAIQEFRREASTASVDFSERFEEGAGQFPFGAEPVLATGCAIQLQEESATIALTLGNARTLNFMLDVRGLHGTLAMLQKAVAQSEWDLDRELEPESPADTPTLKAGLH